jgi:hypothetical protein
MKSLIIFLLCSFFIASFLQADINTTIAFLQDLDAQVLHKKISQPLTVCRDLTEYRIRDNVRERTGFEIRITGNIECIKRTEAKGDVQKRLTMIDGIYQHAWNIDLKFTFQFEAWNRGELWVFPINQKTRDTWKNSLPKGTITCTIKTNNNNATLDMETEFIGETDIPQEYTTDLPIDHKYIPRMFTKEFLIEKAFRKCIENFIQKKTGLTLGVLQKKNKKPWILYRTLN